MNGGEDIGGSKREMDAVRQREMIQTARRLRDWWARCVMADEILFGSYIEPDYDQLAGEGWT